MLLRAQGVVRIATDLETKFTQDGKQITSFSVVSSDKWKTQGGEQREDSCFVKATAFGGLAKIISDYCHKGSKIYITASLKQDEWEDAQGNKKSMHSLKIDTMEMLDARQDTQQSQANYQNPPQQNYQQATPQNNMDNPNRHNAGGAHNRPSQQQQQAYQQQNSPQHLPQQNQNTNPQQTQQQLNQPNQQGAQLPTIEIDSDIPFTYISKRLAMSL